MEHWRAIPGYEGRYEASSLGRIRSLARLQAFCRLGKPATRKIAGRILKPSRDPDGYPNVPLRKDGKFRLVTVHRLVCLAFHGGPTPLHREVAHLDGCRTNATADNLKWVSKAENRSHRKIHGTECIGEQHPRAKLTDSAVRTIKERLRSGQGATRIAASYGVTPACIDSIKRGRNWRHI